MGDSGRRRGSMRDVVDEDLPSYTNRGRYREYSDLPHNNILKPRGHSRWSSWEEKGGPVVKDKNDDAETREQLHNNSYYRSMSPDFDGLEQQKWSNTPDKQWSQPRRYGERRRSSSRGMEKSRSRSPGWSRGGNHTRNWSRSRSRSRSRSKGSIRGHSRSRSPFSDHGLESHRWSDRKSSRGISSQTCKDFLSGMCRRGSQCRFPHSDNILRDDERLDSDIGGRWKGKQEPGHGSRFHYDKAADKFSDVYHGENDPSRNRPRGAITCRDFVKGNCRFGESCRFSHSVENDNVDRSFKNVSVDPDHGHNSKKSGRALCKFFLAGNCRRDNCRFSHDTPLSGEREDRIHEKVGGEPEDTLDEWTGPVWDAAEKPANTRKISRWGASVDADLNLSGDVSLGRRGDERWGRSLEDEAMGWEHNKSLNTDNYHANNRENEETSRRTDSNFMVTEKSRGESQQNRSYDDFRSHSLDKLAPHIPNHNLGEQQQNRTYEEFRSHSLDKLAPHIPNHNIGEPQQNRTYEEFRSHSLEKLSPHIPNRNHGREAAQHYLSSASENPHVSMAPATHQYQGMEEHNRGPALESGDLYERKDFRNTNGQSVNPEIRSPFCDNSSLSNMKGQRMLSPLSNALKVDLNESGSGHVTFPSNEDFQINRQQSTIHHMPEPSTHSSFPVQTPSDKFAPLNTLPNSVSNAQTIPIHVAKSLLNELQTQLNTVLKPSTFLTIAPSQSLHRPVPVDYQQNISNSTISLDQHPRTKNDTFYAANDRKARELLSSLSMIDPHLSTLHHSSDLKVVGNDDSEENQPEAVKELEVNDNGDKVNMSSQIEADNICSNRADDQGKEEGGLNNKDEKMIRLFKNALVELVKDILKPKWKEGKMSREVHKTVVKKVVDKVTVTIPAEHVPKTQEKIEQYLSSNRPKITKLAQAYVERSLKAGS